ncbi:MAG: 50S ribosomal protein L15 [Ignavibacteriales bacterium]|nr:MAG: 50S ribosomal protein L15 [Ignavibacteriaceae bacterium]MBW7873076.1 50S ribosomal protein L15 [Ignavibacteria bacterium]MCZ2142719.1 50S ribosomal protein L15 [Ignavibacteriales bacterium]OQY77159.1 MAG: 50S ribosomal protein L15 [Ignavibacteriales bacterium UTCHB3]MBV6443815.1 50S ribosomal protein L15 [Ignavibacteriaceae bacterium]
MSYLSNLKYAAGAVKKKKRVARGSGSGHGKTATRGSNGQLSRSGAKRRAWFEGGQMPIQRRVPKFGFTPPFKIHYQAVNLYQIQKLIDAGKLDENTVTIEVLFQAGVISKAAQPVKILGSGEITSAVTVKGHQFSKSAIEKIEAAGGKTEKI